ncbi:protein mono-ADP-ribosyltransferase PARP12-like [Rana temporaria]|uniref:protein mono-ADP-ribosyltransferase PARP12-like n=1 Tax=Rana temporaria TaxID=8407 RepID=UPI001AADFF64|nr:protein mono-ADP-ribosyltransferase PARP12-like [Rana temporaria]
MSDPAVTAYLTKLLCSHNGRLEINHLANLLDLSAKQIEQILQEELLRFPQSSRFVLARSPLRICTNYLHLKGEEEEEEKCRKLHLCRDYLRGQCFQNRRPRCRFSHNVFSDHNYAVLKANELSGLNEEEIKVLLLQNDNQLLPAACRKYMYKNCDKEEDCTRLHVCIYFLQGECNNRSCKSSHNLLESNLLLTCSWLSQETIENFQMLCVLTHNERRQALREEPRNEEPRGRRGISQGIGKGRPGKRRAGSRYRSSERRNKAEGPHVHQQSDSSLRSRSSAGQRLGDTNYNCDDERVHSRHISTTRLESLMDEWFSPNISPLENVQGKSSRTSAGVTPQEGTRSVPSTKDLFVWSNVTKPELLCTPALPVEFYNSRVAQAFPALLSTPCQPTFTTLKSGPSVTSSTSFSPSKGGASTQVKQPTGSASLSTVSSIPSLPSKTLVTSSRESSFIAEPSLFRSRISEKASSVSGKSVKSTRSPSTANQVPVKDLGEKLCSPVAEPVNVKPIPSLKTAISLCSSESPSIAQPKPATSAALADNNLNELGTWTNYQHLNTKKACASILSSELETINISNPTRTNQFTAGNQKDNPNCQKMKQVNMHHLPESEMHQKVEFLDFDRVKMLKGSIKSDTSHSKQKPGDSPRKMVIYPPTWDLKAMPETGYQNIPVPQTCDEFSTVAKMFSKTVQGYKVRKVWRIQNPTLWQAYQRQKDQMKKKNVGIDVNEQQLFHGTDNVTTICKNNFDWHSHGPNGILCGQGNYFAGDASYAHNYSPTNSAGTRTMFVARVLVGDFIQGDLTMKSPPQKRRSNECYDSYVNSVTSPSLFMVFEKSQVYPEYILEYKKKEKSACVIN